jgi:acyl-CoA synthetase (AMP-forming)/AMP-acid ligase II
VHPPKQAVKNRLTNDILKKNLRAPDQFSAALAKLGAAHPAIEFSGRTTTFGQLDALSNQMAHFGLKEQLAGNKQTRSVDLHLLLLRAGSQTCALFMHNCPEYVAVWLGLAKIGVRTALINCELVAHALFLFSAALTLMLCSLLACMPDNLKLESLVHSISVSESKLVIFGAELIGPMRDVLPQIKATKARLFCLGALCCLSSR